MSSASYLGSRVVEMFVGAAVSFVGWMLTFFVSPADWNVDSEAGFFERIRSAGSTVFLYSSSSRTASADRRFLIPDADTLQLAVDCP